MSNEISDSISSFKITPEEPAMSVIVPELTQDEFMNKSIQILNEGVQNHYSKKYVTDQLFDLSKQNPNTATALDFPTDHVSIKQNVVAPWYGDRASTGPDPKSVAPVTTVVFDRSDKTIALYSGNTCEADQPPPEFPAGNNVTKDSNGPWPKGEYPFYKYKAHPESGPNDGYGSHGIFIFEVPGRTGMGVHSGRANKGGPAHPTLGCVRTTDEGTEALTHATDSLQTIQVLD